MTEHGISTPAADVGGEYRPNDAFRRVLIAKRDLERRMGWGR